MERAIGTADGRYQLDAAQQATHQAEVLGGWRRLVWLVPIPHRSRFSQLVHSGATLRQSWWCHTCWLWLGKVWRAQSRRIA